MKWTPELILQRCKSNPYMAEDAGFMEAMEACIKDAATYREIIAPRVRSTENTCDCGCNIPIATDPLEMLEFLAGRFEFAGVGEAVARSYAKDIRAILGKMDAAISQEARQQEMK